MPDTDKHSEESDNRRIPYCRRCKKEIEKQGVKFCPECKGLVLYYSKKEIQAMLHQKTKGEVEVKEKKSPAAKSSKSLPEMEEEEYSSEYQYGSEESYDDES